MDLTCFHQSIVTILKCLPSCPFQTRNKFSHVARSLWSLEAMAIPAGEIIRIVYVKENKEDKDWAMSIVLVFMIRIVAIKIRECNKWMCLLSVLVDICNQGVKGGGDFTLERIGDDKLRDRPSQSWIKLNELDILMIESLHLLEIPVMPTLINHPAALQWPETSIIV